MKFRYITMLFVIMSLSFLLVSCENSSNISDDDSSVEVKAGVESQKQESQNKSSDTPYLVGQDYEILEKEYNTENPDKVVVFEFFGYTCPHCFHFEAFIDSWAQSKSDYVQFEKVALNFHSSWSIYQQAYLTAQTMGVADKAHNQLFKALHRDNIRFNSIEDLAAWYADETGIDKEEFVSTAGSFIIDANQRKADSLGFLMQITATPTVIVDGKYKVLPKKDRNEEIKVLNFLVAKRAQEKALITE